MEEKHVKKSQNGDRPVGDDDRITDEMRALARKFEEKYGCNTKKSKKKRSKDISELGFGYDESDSFIDNSEMLDEAVPSNVRTQHGGFYINSGTLHLETIDESGESDDEQLSNNLTAGRQKRVRRVSSDNSDSTAHESETSDNAENGDESHQPPLQSEKLKNAVSSSDRSETATKGMSAAGTVAASQVLKKRRLLLKSKEKAARQQTPVTTGVRSLQQRLKQKRNRKLQKLQQSCASAGISSEAVATANVSPAPRTSATLNDNDGQHSNPARTEAGLRRLDVSSNAVSGGTTEADSQSASSQSASSSSNSSDDSSDDSSGGSSSDSSDEEADPVQSEGGKSPASVKNGAFTPDAPSPSKPPNKPSKTAVLPALPSPSNSVACGHPSMTASHPLPAGLCSELTELLDEIRAAAVVANQSGEGKRKFFSADINRILLNIELHCLKLSRKQRQSVFLHLADHLPCGIQTLVKRAKHLLLDAEKDSIRKPLNRLRSAVAACMPAVKQNYENEYKRIVQLRELLTTADSGSASARPPLPSRTFQWNDVTRSRLKRVVELRAQSFKMLAKRQPTVEEFLKTFLEDDVLPIWENGWMSISELMTHALPIFQEAVKSKISVPLNVPSLSSKKTAREDSARSGDSLSAPDTAPPIAQTASTHLAPTLNVEQMSSGFCQTPKQSVPIDPNTACSSSETVKNRSPSKAAVSAQNVSSLDQLWQKFNQSSSVDDIVVQISALMRHIQTQLMKKMLDESSELNNIEIERHREELRRLQMALTEANKMQLKANKQTQNLSGKTEARTSQIQTQSVHESIDTALKSVNSATLGEGRRDSALKPNGCANSYDLSRKNNSGSTEKSHSKNQLTAAQHDQSKKNKIRQTSDKHSHEISSKDPDKSRHSVKKQKQQRGSANHAVKENSSSKSMTPTLTTTGSDCSLLKTSSVRDTVPSSAVKSVPSRLGVLAASCESTSADENSPPVETMRHASGHSSMCSPISTISPCKPVCSTPTTIGSMPVPAVSASVDKTAPASVLNATAEREIASLSRLVSSGNTCVGTSPTKTFSASSKSPSCQRSPRKAYLLAATEACSSAPSDIEEPRNNSSKSSGFREIKDTEVEDAVASIMVDAPPTDLVVGLDALTPPTLSSNAHDELAGGDVCEPRITAIASSAAGSSAGSDSVRRASRESLSTPPSVSEWHSGALESAGSFETRTRTAPSVDTFSSVAKTKQSSRSVVANTGSVGTSSSSDVPKRSSETSAASVSLPIPAVATSGVDLSVSLYCDAPAGDNDFSSAAVSSAAASAINSSALNLSSSATASRRSLSAENDGHDFDWMVRELMHMNGQITSTPSTASHAIKTNVSSSNSRTQSTNQRFSSGVTMPSHLPRQQYCSAEVNAQQTADLSRRNASINRTTSVNTAASLSTSTDALLAHLSTSESNIPHYSPDWFQHRKQQQQLQHSTFPSSTVGAVHTVPSYSGASNKTTARYQPFLSTDAVGERVSLHCATQSASAATSVSRALTSTQCVNAMADVFGTSMPVSIASSVSDSIDAPLRQYMSQFLANSVATQPQQSQDRIPMAPSVGENTNYIAGVGGTSASASASVVGSMSRAAGFSNTARPFLTHAPALLNLYSNSFDSAQLLCDNAISRPGVTVNSTPGTAGHSAYSSGLISGNMAAPDSFLANNSLRHQPFTGLMPQSANLAHNNRFQQGHMNRPSGRYPP